MGFLDKVLHDDEEVTNIAITEKKKPVSHGFSRNDFFIALAIFATSIAIRIYFLYNFTDPENAGDGWYGDTYHHWQIAYLTKEIGLGESFLRLWDLKGMEYFWGPVHPLLMILMFAVTGVKSIVLSRILSIIFGSGVLALLYLIAKKNWNRWVGVSAALLSMVNPVVIFNDSSGMLEPIGLFFLLLAIILLKPKPIIAGVSLVFALMVRAEAWIFSLLIIFLEVWFRKRSSDVTKVILGFLVPLLLYMKYLLDYTGNPVYPLWWNYLANAKGVWAGDADMAFTAYQVMVKPYLVGWFIVSLIITLIVLWKRPKGAILLSFGFINWAFFGGFFGLTHYLKGFEPWFWYIRFFVFPYIFLGLLLCILIFYILPMLHKSLKHNLVNIALFLPLIIFATTIQFFWTPIMSEYRKTTPTWERTKYWGEETGKYYEGGKVLISEGYPSYTYTLVQYGGVEGKNIVGQMFDPFYYMGEAPFENWGENRIKVLKWLKDEDIRLLIAEPRVIAVGDSIVDNSRYIELIKREPEIFEKVGFLAPFKGSDGEILQIYKVKNDMIGDLENEI